MKMWTVQIIPRLVVVLLPLLLLCGCGKKSVPKASAPPPVENQTAPPVALAVAPRPAGPPVAHPAPPSQVSLPANATAEAAAGQMTMELRPYVAYTLTIPKFFEDFIAHHPMKFPPAPPGKNYAIEDGRIIVR